MTTRFPAAANAGIFTLRLTVAVALCATAALFGSLSLRASPRTPKTDPSANWSIVHSADMAPQDLLGVSCSSAADCWSVGYYTNSSNVIQTLAHHWDGSAWTVVPTPNVTSTDANRFADVACLSSSDCWAVGRQTVTDTTFNYTLVEHWDGNAWTVVASPNPDESARLRDIACTTTTDCWAVGESTSGTLTEHWDGKTWSIVASPNPGTAHQLRSVACPDSANCWAVGFYDNGETQQRLIEHWDGVLWTVVESGEIDLLNLSILSAITCNSNTDCWAVGEQGSHPALIEHWDGATWSVVPAAYTGTAYNQLNGVTCVSAFDCWAVGSQYEVFDKDTAFRFYTIIEHWDGVSWSNITAPHVNAPNNSDILRGVACTSLDHCWAVGDFNLNTPLIAEWNGTAWTKVPATRIDGSGVDNFLFDTTCVSSSDCWAVGFNGALVQVSGTADNALTQHWDGNAWSVVDSANASYDDNHLFGIACVTSADCWAVGASGYSESSFSHTLIQHWNGTDWSLVESPNVSDDNWLQKVTCTSTSDCWAVGFYYNENETAQTVIQHWNGAAWVVVPSPNGSASNDNFLNGVACTSVSDCWAVGYYFESATANALFLRWDGKTWSSIAPPDPGAGNSNLLLSVACISSTDCWAVGIATTPGNQHTLFEHWDGLNWMIVSTPSISVSAPILNGVTCSSSTECWAVGRYFDPVSHRQPMVVRWDGNEWSFFSSPITDSGRSSQLRGVTCTSASHCWAVGDFQSDATDFNRTLIEALTPIPGLTSVVSTKTHNTTPFDIDLPADGTGIECRSGGATGDYTIVFNFTNTLLSVEAANVTAGTGSVASTNIGADAHQLLVNLTGVINAQRVTITLGHARDSEGDIGNAMSATMGVLFGDTNGDGAVNSSDISQTKSQSGQEPTTSNFRQDLNADGAINSADVSLVKSRSGTALPAQQQSRAAHSEGF